jgi:hypothetical protein
MNRLARNLWLVLAAIVALIAWALTLWITHVDHTPGRVITITFNQQPPLRFERAPGALLIMLLRPAHLPFPGVALTSPSSILFMPTPATQSIVVSGGRISDLSCSSVDVKNGGVTALLADSGKGDAITPIAVEQHNRDILVPIPLQLSRTFRQMPNGLGAIQCKFSRSQSANPTFTERAVTVQANTQTSGALLVDVSALEDIDDLRFSGGLEIPFGGERARLLYGNDNAVSLEWSDVNAQQKRDIVLVIVGALSAIAAAMVIEVLRPAVESKAKSRD